MVPLDLIGRRRLGTLSAGALSVTDLPSEVRPIAFDGERSLIWEPDAQAPTTLKIIDGSANVVAAFVVPDGGRPVAVDVPDGFVVARLVTLSGQIEVQHLRLDGSTRVTSRFPVVGASAWPVVQLARTGDTVWLAFDGYGTELAKLSLTGGATGPSESVAARGSTFVSSGDRALLAVPHRRAADEARRAADPDATGAVVVR